MANRGNNRKDHHNSGCRQNTNYPKGSYRSGYGANQGNSSWRHGRGSGGRSYNQDWIDERSGWKIRGIEHYSYRMPTQHNLRRNGKMWSNNRETIEKGHYNENPGNSGENFLQNPDDLLHMKVPSEFNPAVPPPTLFKNPQHTHYADPDPAHPRHPFPPGRQWLTGVKETVGKRKRSVENYKTEGVLNEKLKKIKTEIKCESSSDEYEETKTIRILSTKELNPQKYLKHRIKEYKVLESRIKEKASDGTLEELLLEERDALKSIILVEIKNLPQNSLFLKLISDEDDGCEDVEDSEDLVADLGKHGTTKSFIRFLNFIRVEYFESTIKSLLSVPVDKTRFTLLHSTFPQPSFRRSKSEDSANQTPTDVGKNERENDLRENEARSSRQDTRRTKSEERNSSEHETDEMEILSEKPRRSSAENAQTISVDYQKADNAADTKEEELKLDLEDFKENQLGKFKLRFKNISRFKTETDVRSHFSIFGDIYRIHLEDEEPVSPGDKLKGFDTVYIEFESGHSMYKAILETNLGCRVSKSCLTKTGLIKYGYPVEDEQLEPSSTWFPKSSNNFFKSCSFEMENDSCSANKNLPTPKMTSESSIQEPSSSKQECNSSISNISVRSLSELKEKESYYEKIEFKKRRNSCENGKKDENENSQKRKSSERRKMEKRSKERSEERSEFKQRRHSNESRMSDSRERKKKDRRNRSSEEQMKEEDRSNQSCKANLPDLKLELSNLKQRGEKEDESWVCSECGTFNFPYRWYCYKNLQQRCQGTRPQNHKKRSLRNYGHSPDLNFTKYREQRPSRRLDEDGRRSSGRLDEAKRRPSSRLDEDGRRSSGRIDEDERRSCRRVDKDERRPFRGLDEDEGCLVSEDTEVQDDGSESIRLNRREVEEEKRIQAMRNIQLKEKLNRTEEEESTEEFRRHWDIQLEDSRRQKYRREQDREYVQSLRSGVAELEPGELVSPRKHFINILSDQSIDQSPSALSYRGSQDRSATSRLSPEIQLVEPDKHLSSGLKPNFLSHSESNANTEPILQIRSQGFETRSQSYKTQSQGLKSCDTVLRRLLNLAGGYAEPGHKGNQDLLVREVYDVEDDENNGNEVEEGIPLVQLRQPLRLDEDKDEVICCDETSQDNSEIEILENEAGPPAPSVTFRSRSQQSTHFEIIGNEAGPPPLPVNFKSRSQPSSDLEIMENEAGPPPPPVTSKSRSQPSSDLEIMENEAGPPTPPVTSKSRSQPSSDLEIMENEAGPPPPPVTSKSSSQPSSDLEIMENEAGPPTPPVTSKSRSQPSPDLEIMENEAGPPPPPVTSKSRSQPCSDLEIMENEAGPPPPPVTSKSRSQHNSDLKIVENEAETPPVTFKSRSQPSSDLEILENEMGPPQVSGESISQKNTNLDILVNETEPTPITTESRSRHYSDLEILEYEAEPSRIPSESISQPSSDLEILEDDISTEFQHYRRKKNLGMHVYERTPVTQEVVTLSDSDDSDLGKYSPGP